MGSWANLENNFCDRMVAEILSIFHLRSGLGLSPDGAGQGLASADLLPEFASTKAGPGLPGFIHRRSSALMWWGNHRGQKRSSGGFRLTGKLLPESSQQGIVPGARHEQESPAL